MRFLEKDLEEIIYTTDKAKLSKRGLNITGKLFRQLRIGNYGIADLVEVKRIPATLKEASKYDVDNQLPFGSYFKIGDTIIQEEGMLSITVYELKKEKIGISAFLQAIGYMKGISRYLQKRGVNNEVRISLVGKSVDEKSTFLYLSDFLHTENKNLLLNNYIYSYGVDGLTFEKSSGWKLNEEGF